MLDVHIADVSRFVAYDSSLEYGCTETLQTSVIFGGPGSSYVTGETEQWTVLLDA